jgi:hypothetical protein
VISSIHKKGSTIYYQFVAGKCLYVIIARRESYECIASQTAAAASLVRLCPSDMSCDLCFT